MNRQAQRSSLLSLRPESITQSLTSPASVGGGGEVADARLGYHDYTCVDNVFEMVPPGASAAELAGLAGVSVPEDPDSAQS